MSGTRFFPKPIIFATVILAIAGHASAQTVSRLSTRFLARGEQALLEIALAGAQPSDIPITPKVPGVDIRPIGNNPKARQPLGKRLEFVFEYLVSSYETGTHVIPPVEVRTGNSSSHTQALEFNVFNPDELVWSEAESGGTRFRYASSFRTMNPTPYEGETTPVEIKLFVPADLFVEDWGIPDFERDGVTAWRFEPSTMRGQINLLGMPYVSVAYPSTLTPIRNGTVGIGPAKIRLITTHVVMDGFMRRVSQEVSLTVTRLSLETAPLPPGAPEGFENAIGNFAMKVSSSLTTVEEGDPVAVDIVVSGSGNLDTLRPPQPIDAEGWKVYEATTGQRGDERRDLSGNTVFQQFLRPLEFKPAIPAFRLVYFDPKKQKYQTLTSDPIPLKMTPAATRKADASSPPPKVPVPVERMTDILGILQPASLTITSGNTIPFWSGHLLGLIVALGLAIKALWMRVHHRFHKDPARVLRQQALRDLARMKQADDATFLKAAGAFVERWHGESLSPDLQTILTERDNVCFREDRRDSFLDPGRRITILRTLHKAALTVAALFAFLLTAEPARASDPATLATEAYQSARYDEAITYWLQAGPYEQLSPDTLYNIGNACYRAGSPGYAALYYRRALARDPSHQESRQNLRFIERQYGAVTIHRPDYQHALARFPLDTWKNLVWSGAWLCVIAILVFPATRPGARARIAAIAAWVIGPIVAASGGLGWMYYPDDAEFSPLARQTVIIHEKAVLHSDAARTSPEVIDAPPGSLCEVIQETGRWSYVAFATKTRGWILSNALEKVIPAQAPAPPRIPKPKADDKTA